MKINLLPFELVNDNIEIEVFEQREKAAHSAYITFYDCPKLWNDNPGLDEDKWLFYPLDGEASCYGKSYNTRFSLKSAPSFAKKYIKQILIDHFRTLNGVAVECDHIGNVVVWVPSNDGNKKGSVTVRMQRFTLCPHFKTYSEGFELLVSYLGTSTVYLKPVSELNLSTTNYRVLLNKKIRSIKNLTPQEKADIDKAYPIINKELEKELNVNAYFHKPSNRYVENMNLIGDFIRDFLFTDELQAYINFLSTDFEDIPQNCILNASADCSRILFGNGQSFSIPSEMANYYQGLSKFGPHIPSPKNDVRFLYIFQASKENNEAARKLIEIFQKGLGNFPGLGSFIRQQFTANSAGRIDTIRFTSCSTALQEIQTQLIKKQLDTSNVTYLAIYLSPVSKNEAEHHELYFKIKELLLTKSITSQSIYIGNISNPSFKYFLPNIASAILAKIQGTPWALQSRGNEGDLIIGVGAFMHNDIGERYIGSAFSFNENGLFENLDCYKSDDLGQLIAGIKKAIGHFVVEHEDKTKLKRLIIHYYKEMSDLEAKPITDMLYTLGYQIPVYVVTINKTETSDFIAFNPDSSDLMPLSGTFIQIKPLNYLVYNNAKYDEGYSTGRGKKDYLFPIRIRIARADKDADGKRRTVSQQDAQSILEQVYQFSRMYWKSVSQQNMPITVCYPEMVAEIVPYFDEKELPPFGKTNMWFL